jgi:HD-GYP domain-containing protein (c-di-GMP phosphodiesterase class II)
MNKLTRKLSDSLRISVTELRLGMFISEMDKPWAQTPFLLQGFLLTELLDFETVKSIAKEVVIDPRRSDPQSLLHLPWESLHLLIDDGYETRPRVKTVAVQNHVNIESSTLDNIKSIFKDEHLVASSPLSVASKKTSTPRAYTGAQPFFMRYQDDTQSSSTALADGRKLPPPSTLKFSEFLSELYPRDVIFAPLNLIERWKNWRDQKNSRKLVARSSAFKNIQAKKERPNFIPSSIPLVRYVDRVPMQQELQHARVVIEKTDALIKKLTQDIQQSDNLDLEEVTPTVQLLTDSVIANPAALMWLLRMRSENTVVVAHALKVAVYMMTLGRHMGFARQQLTELGFIGLLLDIGKLEIDNDILDKPEKLSSEEEAIMQQHVDMGIKILESSQTLGHNVFLGINEHHERLDGSGYPQGLQGNAISIFGRIAAVADSFAAMTSARSYDITRSSFDAMKELFKMAEHQLHAPLVEEFVQAIGIFPVGSMVELSTGEVAIVLEHNRVRRLEPKVLVLTTPEKTILEKPILIDIMRQNHPDKETRISILRGLADGAYGLVCHDFYKAKA